MNSRQRCLHKNPIDQQHQPHLYFFVRLLNSSSQTWRLGTEAEVTTIAGLFGLNATQKSRWCHWDHREANKLNEYKYLHFTTHGILWTSNRLSCPESIWRIEQWWWQSLFRWDFNLVLNVDLVALSACQTGLEKSAKEAWLAFRALVYAGARNVMVSYWSVADESTAQMMTRFYQNILQSSTPPIVKHCNR